MTSGAPGRVRIVAGDRKGHRLKVPRGGVRPTSEKVREAIFDVLGSVAGSRVLDLFAGTGAMGLEALSRGADSCVFVEADPHVTAVLRENVRSLDFEGKARVVSAGYREAVKSFLEDQERFDLLFIDPPYRMLAEVERTLTPLVPSLVSVDGIVVVEGDRSLRPTFGGTLVFDRVYGGTRVIMAVVRRSTL